MGKPGTKGPAGSKALVKTTRVGHEPAFREIIGLIESARRRAFQAVNTELIDLYWRVEEYALGLSVSPPLIAECQARLPRRNPLRRKLDVFCLTPIASRVGHRVMTGEGCRAE